MIQPIFTPDAPEPRGHYSQAVRANGFLFLATQLPTVPGPDPKLPEGMEAQARQVIANVAAVLGACGATLEHVVNASVFITEMEGWPVVNAVFAEAFGAHKPARGVAMSPSLHMGAKVAMQVIAVDPGFAG